MTSDSRPARVAVLVLAAAVVAIVGFGAAKAAKAGTRYATQGYWPAYVQFEVVRDAFQQSVPAGAKVYVDAGQDVHWNSYLREISILCGANLVEARELAQVVVGIEPAPGQAGGVKLIVRPA